MRSAEGDSAAAGVKAVEARIAAAQRKSWRDSPKLLSEAQAAVSFDMSSAMQFGSDVDAASAEHRKWQLIHRYVLLHPFLDDATAPRVRQWQAALGRIRDIGDLDLIEWVLAQADTALAKAKARSGASDVTDASLPTYLLLLRHVAARKRQARAQLKWARDAEQSGWSTCTTATLGQNLINLHAASVHSRDNPDYAGPVDGAYARS